MVEEPEEETQQQQQDGGLISNGCFVPLQRVGVKAKAVDLVGEVSIFQQYHNDSNEAIEAKYVPNLPTFFFLTCVNRCFRLMKWQRCAVLRLSSMESISLVK